jgi:hypothetical protein
MSEPQKLFLILDMLRDVKERLLRIEKEIEMIKAQGVRV